MISSQTDSELEPDVPRRGRVLVVDDQKAFVWLLADALMEDGHLVSVAFNGCDLVDRVMAARGDADSPHALELVVSDVRMPRGTGMQALKSLRYLEHRPPVVLMTAFGTEEVKNRAMDLGAIMVLIKPFDVDQFRSLVSNILAA
jgi:DNA-binding NtrC family response regulator